MTLTRISLIFLTLWTIGQFYLIGMEARVPSSDVFVFKEAGVNLASSGKFVAKNLPHMPADMELPYAYYPPVYPFVYGLWSAAFGTDLKASIAFDGVLRLVRTLLLFVLLVPFLRKALSENKTARAVSVFCVLLLISFLSSDGDRPDELALVFGVGAWLCLRKKELRNSIMGGILLGLCGASSPACGVFAAAGALLFWGLESKDKRALVLFPVTAALVYYLCNLPVYLSGGFSRFSKQLPLSLFPYKFPFVEGTSFAQFFHSFGLAMMHSLDVASAHIFAVFWLAFLTGVYFRAFRVKTPPSLTPLFMAPVFFIPLCLFVWTLQPYYFWFCTLSLLVALLGSWLQSTKKTALMFAGILVAFIPLTVQEAKSQFHTLQRPADQKAEYIREKVLKHVRFNESLAVMPDQYYTFRNDRDIANLSYVCHRLADFSYVYVTPTTRHRSRKSPLPIPCSYKTNCFEMVEDLTSKKLFTVLGLETPYYVSGNGGVLYKNTQCKIAKG